MERARTRGQPRALETIAAVVGSGAHAVLLTGPAGVGKTTLALDLAAALLCTAAPAERPCRTCRGCRMVDSGNHPDLHRLAPEGPGGQIRIGERANPDPGTVRRLIADLALMPVEGGARVAIVEAAHRLNDDAQSALLKTLEEPPAGVTIVLCADEEERLLPTVRSRCVRIRLGAVALREIEALLGDAGVADAPTAARLGRLAHGLPGAALAWAAAPDTVIAHQGLVRLLLDLVAAPRARRLAAARDLIALGGEVAARSAEPRSGPPPEAASPGRRGRRGAPASGPAVAGELGEAGAAEAAESQPGDGSAARKVPVAERRRAVVQLVEAWRDLARDLAVVQRGDVGLVRDTALIDDLIAVAPSLAPGAAERFLAFLGRSGELLEANVGPELVLDSMLLAWPRPMAAATPRS
jgi:DNA polymerase III delta' subunit